MRYPPGLRRTGASTSRELILILAVDKGVVRKTISQQVLLSLFWQIHRVSGPKHGSQLDRCSGIALDRF